MSCWVRFLVHFTLGELATELVCTVLRRETSVVRPESLAVPTEHIDFVRQSSCKNGEELVLFSVVR